MAEVSEGSQKLQCAEGNLGATKIQAAQLHEAGHGKSVVVIDEVTVCDAQPCQSVQVLDT